MNKVYIFIIFVIIIFLGFSGFMIYNYNKSFNEEQLQSQQNINQVKQEQERLDQEFENEQTQNAQDLEQERIAQLEKDEDNDGLTYQEELELGTSDNDKDTDADGIEDDLDLHPAGGGATYTITVDWTNQGLPYTTQFGIHEDKYNYYKNQERYPCCSDWTKYVTPEDPTIKTIAQDVTDVSISTGDTNKAQIAINFVESMIYQYDLDYNSQMEWPKYPIETIIDEYGDCEDTSFLMSSILEALGYDTILLIYSDHAAVGLWCENCIGTYYEYNEKKYFFLETTGYADNWEIGLIPNQYIDEDPAVIN